MPILAPVAEGGAIALSGLTATEVAVAGVAATAVVVSGLAVVDVIDDYLDTPASESEVDSILSQAGDRSKAEQRRLRDCADCVWCMINIQAQGTYFPLRDRSDPQGIGPYLVNGRTVYSREGVVVAAATHEFARGLASRKNFREVESWDLLGRTIAYIQSRPPNGIPPNTEYRVAGTFGQNSKARYDINTFGTISAFMV